VAVSVQGEETGNFISSFCFLGFFSKAGKACVFRNDEKPDKQQGDSL